jgi:hypothetical protein
MKTELDNQIRRTLRSMTAASSSHIGEAIEDVGYRYSRRRLDRRIVTASSAAAIVVGGVLGVSAIREDQPEKGQQAPRFSTQPSTSTPPATLVSAGSTTEVASTAELSLLSIDVTVREDGEDLTFAFNQALPSRVLTPWDAERGIGDSLSYGVQSPDQIQNCAATHGNAGPGMETGSFDIYIPAEWWSPTALPADYELNWHQPKSLPPSTPGPGLIFACGPYDGYVQYTVTAPSSDDLKDIAVTIAPSGDRLLIEVRR